jgi:hypothetical protein
MAQLLLTRREAEEGYLPAVCMRCGEPAEVVCDKLLSWRPELEEHPALVVAFFLAGLVTPGVEVLRWIQRLSLSTKTKRARIRFPFCRKHRNYWFLRHCFVYGGLTAIVLLGAAALIAFLDTKAQNGLISRIGGVACVGIAIGGIVWLFAAAILETKTMSATEITPDTITLVKVSPRFVQAFHRYCQGSGISSVPPRLETMSEPSGPSA